MNRKVSLEILVEFTLIFYDISQIVYNPLNTSIIYFYIFNYILKNNMYPKFYIKQNSIVRGIHW